MQQNTNQPNLLSNELDQVPKNRKTGYKDRIYAMKVEIEAAFDQFIDIDGDKQILNRLKHNQEKLPLHKIYKLQAWKTQKGKIRRKILRMASSSKYAKSNWKYSVWAML